MDRLKLLYITIEFSAATFSGNGIYATSQVRALQSGGHAVLVLMARPDSHPLETPAQSNIEVVVPAQKWGRLDEGSPWQEFVAGAQASEVIQAVQAFEPDAVICVDWHGAAAWLQMRAGRAAFEKLPWLFLSCRIFSRNTEHSEVVQDEESRAAATASATVVLSRADQEFVQASGWLSAHQKCAFVPPALRQDVAQLPAPTDLNDVDAFKARRRYITCCVRLSPEKEPLVFVNLIRSLHRRGVLQRHGLTPLLCASSQSEYAAAVKAAFREAAPLDGGQGGRLEERFLGPADLGEIYAQTLINVHPCAYDAFGMTIVEAASQGAPSLVHNAGTVGATEVLSYERHCIPLDLGKSADDLAQEVEELLSDTERLLTVGRAAAAAARAYDEASNARQLLDVLQPHLQCLLNHS